MNFDEWLNESVGRIEKILDRKLPDYASRVLMERSVESFF